MFFGQILNVRLICFFFVTEGVPFYLAKFHLWKQAQSASQPEQDTVQLILVALTVGL